MPGQIVDSRDLAIFFYNKVYRNPKSKVFEIKTQEYFTEEGFYCKVCGFHSRRFIIRTNRGNTVIICLSCGDRVWKIPRLKCVP
jgi:transcription elongation factor Elf1